MPDPKSLLHEPGTALPVTCVRFSNDGTLSCHLCVFGMQNADSRRT